MNNRTMIDHRAGSSPLYQMANNNIPQMGDAVIEVLTPVDPVQEPEPSINQRIQRCAKLVDLIIEAKNELTIETEELKKLLS